MISGNILAAREQFWRSWLVNWPIFNNSIAMWSCGIFLPRRSRFWRVDQWIRQHSIVPLLCDLTVYCRLDGAVIGHSSNELATLEEFHCFVIARNVHALKEPFLHSRLVNWPTFNNSNAMWSRGIFLPRRSRFGRVDQWIRQHSIIPLLCDLTRYSSFERTVVRHSINELVKIQ